MSFFRIPVEVLTKENTAYKKCFFPSNFLLKIQIDKNSTVDQTVSKQKLNFEQEQSGKSKILLIQAKKNR